MGAPMGTRLFPCGCTITEDCTAVKGPRPILGVRTCTFHGRDLATEWKQLAERVLALQSGPAVTD